MIRAAQEAEEKEMQAKLSPEEFRVWRIRQDEPYLRQSHEQYGTPLPPELDETYKADQTAATPVAASPTQTTDARRNESGIRPAFQQALDRARIKAQKPTTREEMWAIADRFYGTKKGSPSE